MRNQEGKTRLDVLLRAIDEAGHVRFFVADTRNMVEEMRKIHHASFTATAAMGRLLTMMTLLSLSLDNDGDALTVNIKSDGPGGYLVGLSDVPGEARVTAQNPEADLPSRTTDGKLDVGRWVGRDGTLSFVRSYALKEPFSGITPLVSGEIAEDFAQYFYQSEQTASVVSLGVLVAPDATVQQAGGIFLQLMPDCTDEEVGRLETAVGQMPSITKILDEGLSPEELLQRYFADFHPTVTEQHTPHYACHCSREKMHRALLSLDVGSRRTLAEENHGAEVVCDFCRKTYQFSGDALKKPGETW